MGTALWGWTAENYVIVLSCTAALLLVLAIVVGVRCVARGKRENEGEITVPLTQYTTTTAAAAYTPISQSDVTYDVSL